LIRLLSCRAKYRSEYRKLQDGFPKLQPVKKSGNEKFSRNEEARATSISFKFNWTQDDSELMKRLGPKLFESFGEICLKKRESKDRRPDTGFVDTFFQCQWEDNFTKTSLFGLPFFVEN
jgi:hypothetical protein